MLFNLSEGCLHLTISFLSLSLCVIQDGNFALQLLYC